MNDSKEMNEQFLVELCSKPPRDPARIQPFLQALGEEWAKFPDLRFGQLMFNFIAENGDPFHLEENEFLKRITEYINNDTAAQKVHMKIEIESRESIKKRADAPFPPHTAIISITDTDAEFAMLKNKPEFLFQIKFDDIYNDILDEICNNEYGNNYPALKGAIKTSKKLEWFSDTQAKEIAKFIFSIFNKAHLLICQCEYGQSRSAAVAAAVEQFLYQSGIFIFADDRYFPNKLVYRKLSAALEKGYRVL